MELTTAQLKAIKVLANGGSADEAGQAAKVTNRTIYNWKKCHLFSAVLSKTKADIHQEAIGVLRQSSRTAAEVLREIASDVKITPIVRIKAAEAILDKSKPEKSPLSEIEAVKTLVELGVMPEHVLTKLMAAANEFSSKVRDYIIESGVNSSDRSKEEDSEE